MHRTGSPVDMDPEQVNELARNFWYSAILRAGIKLDVFSILEGNNLTSGEVARRIGASPRYVQAFLDCCGVLDLLDKEGDQYTNSPLTSRFLVKNKKEYVGDHALHHTNTWASWGRLDEIVKEGKTLLPYETGFVDAPTYWTDYMIGQHNRAESGQARHLVESLDLRGKHKMLDLGGGAASYSIALCAANPDLHAVVVDQKEPLDIARPLVEQHDLGNQITLLEGDFLDTHLEPDYDVVLISGVVLIKSEADCRALFKVAYDKMLPGGMIVIQDYMRLDHSPTRQKLDALEDLYVLVAFDPGAGDREGDVVSSWLLDAGFQNPNMIPLPTQLAVITAEKP
ncbi:MAG: methyltransferase domain-containing protein [Chloroflexi bacterium]|nr:methyltransferase domain-containing protein [Chloroflexota bacterium]